MMQRRVQYLERSTRKEQHTLAILEKLEQGQRPHWDCTPGGQKRAKRVLV
jgi:hypothetical protein